MKKQQGFSLLEMLVVIAIIGVIAGVTSDMFMQIIKAQNKGNVVTEIKQNGDLILNKIERAVRNAEEISFIGLKSPASGGSWIWRPATSFAATESCPSASEPICAMIVKNPAGVGGYTKIEFHIEPDRECSVPPFTPADQEGSGPTFSCNGNVRLVTDLTNNALAALQNIAPYNTVTTATIGQVITNTEKRSGVSLIQSLIDPTTPTPAPASAKKPLIQIKTTTGKPPLVTIQYSLQQGISAASRTDSRAVVPFELTISLRSY